MKAVHEFLYDVLETELGGVKVYEKSLECALNRDLRSELNDYLAETREHVRIATRLLKYFGLDPERESPGRIVIRHMGESLVRQMEIGLSIGPEEAERVACQAVVVAETHDQLNWELLGKLFRVLEPELPEDIRDTQSDVHTQENEHLFHSKGWVRELWLSSMGLPALLPPPEERMHVKSAIGAEVAKTFAIRRRLNTRSRAKSGR